MPKWWPISWSTVLRTWARTWAGSCSPSSTFSPTTSDVSAWLEVGRTLRDEEDFCFEQLTDLCGVDYLSYGQSEWDTDNASQEGFGRGVEALGPGRFDWASRPEAGEMKQRFGGRRATRHVDVHGNHTVTAAGNRVSIMVLAAAVGAGTH